MRGDCRPAIRWSDGRPSGATHGILLHGDHDVRQLFVTLFLIKEHRVVVRKEDQLSGKEVFRSLPYPTLIIALFVTTLMIQLANASISPILTLFIRQLAADTNNIAFVSGMIAAVPGIAALISAPRLGGLGDRIGTGRILILRWGSRWCSSP